MVLGEKLFFSVPSQKVPCQFPLLSPSTTQKPVPKLAIYVKEKGEKKVKEKFEAKLHDCFPSFRKVSFERISVTGEHAG